MDFRTLFVHIHETLPTLPANKVLILTDALLSTYPATPPVVDNANPESLGAHALTLSKVCDAARCDRKIEAIKELRFATSCSLKEAKDAIESRAFTTVHTNMIYRY